MKLCSRGTTIAPKGNYRRKSTRWRPGMAEGIDYPEDWSVGKCVYVPTPETSPQAIADAQRADVAAAWKGGIRTVEAISEAVILPVSVVRRRLEELGLSA